MGKVGARWNKKDNISGPAASIFVEPKCHATLVASSFKHIILYDTQSDMIRAEPIYEASLSIMASLPHSCSEVVFQMAAKTTTTTKKNTIFNYYTTGERFSLFLLPMNNHQSCPAVIPLLITVPGSNWTQVMIRAGFKIKTLTQSTCWKDFLVAHNAWLKTSACYTRTPTLQRARLLAAF